jgi:AcrR family transcriptional regulator
MTTRGREVDTYCWSGPAHSVDVAPDTNRASTIVGHDNMGAEEVPKSERRRRGRRRDPGVDTAIRDAVVGLLCDGGYSEVTIEAVAQRAGVAHTSIYRRWPSKAYMVHEIVFPDRLLGSHPDVPFEEGVRGWARGVASTLARREVRAALPGLMADAQGDAELRRRLVDRFEPAVRDSLRRAAATAVERGELRADVDIDLVYDAVIGAAIALPFVAHRISNRRLADSLVDILLDGMRPRPGDEH